MCNEKNAKTVQVHNIEVATYEYFKEFDGLSLPRLVYGIPFEAKVNG